VIFSDSRRHASRLPRDLREQMIDETNAFLNWALRHPGQVPRIPRRRVDRGGFSQLMRMPGARELAGRWWRRALEMVDRD